MDHEVEPMPQLRVALALFVMSAAACSAPPEDAAASSAALTDERGLDVQVVSASSRGAITWDLTASAYDARSCHFADRRTTTSTTEFTATATADCTDAVAAAQGRPPLNRYIETTAWIREDPILSRVVMRHWCAELDVVVAIERDTWDDPAFEGVGFYARDSTDEEPRGDGRTFVAKGDGRLKRVGEAELRNGGTRVYLYCFGGAGPCAVNGSGQDPAGFIEFKPFVRLSNGRERWEAVDANHAVRYRESWSRSEQLLR